MTSTMDVKPRNGQFAVIERETDLIWRTLPTREEAEAWANQAAPRREKHDKK